MSEFKIEKRLPFPITLLFAFCVVFITSSTAVYSDDDYSVGGFIDEDGDGFNDLLPDADGDGVPDPLDPDFKGRMADSSYMERYMYSHGEEHMWQNMMDNMSGDHMGHSEPGMFGPGDSTMHGGHHGGGMGDGMGGSGGGMGGSGGDMGGSGGGMGGDDGGGMGGGGGGMGGHGPDGNTGGKTPVVNGNSPIGGGGSERGEGKSKIEGPGGN